MTTFRDQLPQLDGRPFLTDAGLETDLIFNHDVEIREFAAHTLLETPAGRAALARYFRGFLKLARDCGTGYILDSTTWKAHPHWSQDLGQGHKELERANRDSINFIAELRDEFASNAGSIVLNGVVGPRGDAYAPDQLLSVDESESYHGTQLDWLAGTEVDMVTALTFTQSGEAAGFARAAIARGLPVVISFTVETNGELPSGEPLRRAIEFVDEETDNGVAYFMVNCAHPDHFFHVFQNGDWLRRVRGIRCNASRCSHAELDEAETLDDGNPEELGSSYKALSDEMPWVNVFGGCCGSDLRHVTAISSALGLNAGAR